MTFYHRKNKSRIPNIFSESSQKKNTKDLCIKEEYKRKYINYYYTSVLYTRYTKTYLNTKLLNQSFNVMVIIVHYAMCVSIISTIQKKGRKMITGGFHSAINPSNSTIRKDGREHDASKSGRFLIRCHYSRHSFAASMSRLR